MYIFILQTHIAYHKQMLKSKRHVYPNYVCVWNERRQEFNKNYMRTILFGWHVNQIGNGMHGKCFYKLVIKSVVGIS